MVGTVRNQIRWSNERKVKYSMLGQFEIEGGVTHSDTKIKRAASTPGFSSLSLQSYSRFPSTSFPLYRPELAHSIYDLPMFSPNVTPTSEDATYEEMSAQIASYSRTLFEFTLRLWSESRKRAEEIQKLEEAAAKLDLSRPPQVRTGSMRSAHRADANSQQ